MPSEATGRDYVGEALARVERMTRTITAALAERGFQPVEPAIMQPADILLELYGEDIRRRAFIFQDETHGELCLRPDYTAPVARHFLASGATHARFAYAGPVFRRMASGDPRPAQFLQIGMESYGDPDLAGADAAMFDLTARALDWAGVRGARAMTGDLGIAFAVLDAVTMPESWRQRLKRHFWRPRRFRELLHGFVGENDADGDAGRIAFLKAIGSLGEAQARDAIEEMLAMADTPHIGARSPEAIARRFLAQARDAQAHPMSAEVAALIESILAVRCPLDQALDRLTEPCRAAGVRLDAALTRFERRLQALAGRGVDLSATGFDAAFGRNLEYYDGFVFEFTQGEARLAGGGRYDRMMSALGATSAVTAIGAALRPEIILSLEGAI